MSKLISSYDVQGRKIVLTTPYCEEIRQYCLRNQGVRKNGSWVLPIRTLTHVQDMIGADLDDLVQVQVGSSDWDGYDQIHVGWHVLARRPEWNRPASLDAELIRGTIPRKGGDEDYPMVNPSSDTLFRLWVPRDFADNMDLTVVSKSAQKYHPELGDMADFSDQQLLLECRRRGLLPTNGRNKKWNIVK